MKKLLITLSVIALGAFIVMLIGITLTGISFPYDKTLNQERVFSVLKGQDVLSISGNLEKEKLIKNHWFFEIAVLLRNGAAKLQAGYYKLSQAMTPLEIADKIINGDVAKEILTIPEGWNIRDIDHYLKTKGFIEDNEFLQASKRDYSAEFSFLKDKPKHLNLEGYLFPDTYYLKIGDNPETLVRKMLNNFDKKLVPDLKSEIDNQGKTVSEIVNMASLLEKEVKTIEDKKIVSGILWKRIKIDMYLNVDAAIAYALNKKTGGLSAGDTKIDSPYNTYMYKGLPPGPISNPGLDSILAAIYPKESLNLYYLSTPEGKTVFSKTLQDHIIAIEKYLK